MTVASANGDTKTATPVGARSSGFALGDDDNYEYRPLRIDAHVSRSAAAAMLSVRAEFTGWELVRSRLYADGSRQVMLRRRRTPWMLPGLAL